MTLWPLHSGLSEAWFLCHFRVGDVVMQVAFSVGPSEGFLFQLLPDMMTFLFCKYLA